MKFGAVALVLVETIFGKLRAEVTHHPIARHFRDHARGGDAQTVAIAVDDRRLWKWKWKDRETVDQNVFGRRGERAERDPHRFLRCAQNIDPIDLEMIDHADSPGDFGIGKQLCVNFFATFGRELLRIVQFFMSKFFRQQNRRRYHWSGERAAPRFIDASDSNDSGGAQFLFVTKSAAPIHPRKSLADLRAVTSDM